MSEEAPPGGFLRRWRVPMALAAVLAVSLARTLRWPNDFAEGQWLLSYDYGFMKRGLPGALMNRFVSPEDPGFAEGLIRAVSVAWLALFALGLLAALVRFLGNDGGSRRSLVVVLVLLMSPWVVLAGHLNGYFDPILACAGLASIELVRRGRERGAALLMSLTLLVHESFLVLGYPVVNLVAWRLAGARDERGGAPLDWVRRAPWTLWLPPLVMGGIVLHQAFFLDAIAARDAIVAHLERFPFIEHGRAKMVPATMAYTFFDYLDDQAPRFLRRITRLGYWIRNVLPLLVLLLHPWARFRALPHGRRFYAAYVGVVLLPLLLHAIAWDTERIWSYPFLVALLALWGTSEVEPGRGSGLRWGAAGWLLAALALAAAALTRLRLMDDELDGFSLGARAVLYGVPILFALVWTRDEPRNAVGERT